MYFEVILTKRMKAKADIPVPPWDMQLSSPLSQNHLNGRSDVIMSTSRVISATLANLIDCPSTWLDVMSQGPQKGGQLFFFGPDGPTYLPTRCAGPTFQHPLVSHRTTILHIRKGSRICWVVPYSGLEENQTIGERVAVARYHMPSDTYYTEPTTYKILNEVSALVARGVNLNHTPSMCTPAWLVRITEALCQLVWIGDDLSRPGEMSQYWLERMMEQTMHQEEMPIDAFMAIVDPTE
ncbi:hypothetical protein ARMGADRAFT_1032507 [Armillaria gallica]|uniref:Uncharacterized protein n=1 Tax=Armillaria gallica TaxID=47427 RepID=A0A2H3D8S4_ARMGA|nr:hypothetical protein ARMGADRAFT_1032507 [Armillaria gallica]